MSDQVAALSQFQNECKNVGELLKLKESECEEKVSAIKSLQEEITTLKSQFETLNAENEKVLLIDIFCLKY